MKKIWTKLSLLTVAVAPVAAVVSCGNSDKNQNNATSTANVDFSNVFNTPGNNGSGDSSATNSGAFNNLLAGTLAKDAKTIEPWYGKSRPDDHMKGTNEGVEIKKRLLNGHPKQPGINVSDLWNWTSEATADGQANTTQVGPDGRVKLDYIGNANANGVLPKIDFMGGMPDLDFNKATIREVQPRMFGEQIKPSQSTFAKVTNMNSYTPKNGDTDLGFNRGMITTDLHPVTSSQYVDLDIPWNPGPHFDAKIPSGERIDTLHRQGVPTVGAILMFPRATGEGERNIQILTNPGPNHDFPVAKGMVEMAQKMGFDGWWMDWELHSNKTADFLKALNSYSHYGYYRTDNGTIVNIASKNNGTPLNTIPAADGSDLKDYYKNSKGTYRKLLTANYWEEHTTFQYSDIFTWSQQHGGDATTSTTTGIPKHWKWADDHNRDRYFMNGASNAPEDSMDGCRKILGKYYNAAKDSHPTENGVAIEQNQFSWWLWSYQQSSNIEVNEELFESYAGDPRVFDGADKNHLERFAVSNAFREHTSILGNKDFETTFSYGNGKGFNLWGSKDIHKNVIGTTDQGWTSFGMTDILPTYKWITDFYNAAGADITDLSVNAKGKLANRPVRPFINNQTKEAYYGGATMDYNGSLPVGNSMVQKLYASNIPVKQNDKFKIKIRNKWDNEADRIIPEMALWTSSTKPEYEMYKADGTLNTNAFYKSDGTEADPFDSTRHLGWTSGGEDPSTANYTGTKEPISDLWRYQKDTRAGITTKEQYLKNSNVEDLGNGWLEVTYDLTNITSGQLIEKGGTTSSATTLKDENILDFGLRMTGVKSPENINNLHVGELKFDAAADNTKEIKEIKNLKTIKVWNSAALKFQSARISWETIGADGHEYDPSEIKHYLVFYKNEKGKKTGLAWMGATPNAYLSDIGKAETSQYIQIVAVDYNNNIIFEQDAKVQL